MASFITARNIQKLTKEKLTSDVIRIVNTGYSEIINFPN